MLFGVFAHGAVGSKVRGQPRHAFPHPFDPGHGNAFFVARIKFRNYFAFESFIERLGFGRIPSWIAAMFLTVAQRPA